MRSVKLATPACYHYKGKVYVKDVIYAVEDELAEDLLTHDDGYKKPIFKEATKTEAKDSETATGTATPSTEKPAPVKMGSKSNKAPAKKAPAKATTPVKDPDEGTGSDGGSDENSEGGVQV
jgi:hypothetical protein